MVRVFLLVHWLASEALPMLKIYTLARLISLLQFRDAANYVLNVGNNYVNHMAAKDMTMSMAAVLREWINVRARLSPVLELMIVTRALTFQITRCCYFISASLWTADM